LIGLGGLFVATMVPLKHIQEGSPFMSKGNDKKAKSDKTKSNVSVSSYKAAQGTNKPATSPFSKKPGASQIGRKGA
jgi:hypothetical protein